MILDPAIMGAASGGVKIQTGIQSVAVGAAVYIQTGYKVDAVIVCAGGYAALAIQGGPSQLSVGTVAYTIVVHDSDGFTVSCTSSFTDLYLVTYAAFGA